MQSNHLIGHNTVPERLPPKKDLYRCTKMCNTNTHMHSSTHADLNKQRVLNEVLKLLNRTALSKLLKGQIFTLPVSLSAEVQRAVSDLAHP